MQSAEQAQASLLRSSVAPVLANGVVCAMRDQPADPAGYMAEYLAAAGAGGASAVLDKRKFGQECARLDAELESLNEQLVMARAERARRLPESSDAEALRNAAVSAAAWSETRRLKRLMRSMKIKISEPLSASDWPLSEGVLLVQGPTHLQSVRLCEQLALDFGVSSVDVSHDDPLSAVLEALSSAPENCVLLNNYLSHERAREQIALVGRRVGTPTALLLVDCAPHVHAERIVMQTREAMKAVSREAAEEEAFDWANQVLPALEAAAREAGLPVLRVSADGDLNEQMTSFLVAACSA